MFEWIRINSRAGNRFIAAAGTLFAVTALVLFAYYVISVWDAASLIDRALQEALLVAAIVGVGFVSVARTNLRRLRNERVAGSG